MNPQDYLLRCADGWALHVVRYRPPAGAPTGRGPALFVHGMGANRHNFDLNARHSLARDASRSGFDAFVVELRGRGRSQPPPGVRANWCFDDFLERDLPVVMELVARETGQPVHWVGHSMGGMLGLAWAVRHGEEQLRSLSLFGTPLAFARGQLGLQAWSLVVQLQRFLPTLDQEAWGRRLVPVVRRIPRALRPFLRFLANPDNVDLETTADIFGHLVTNEAPALILQFADWVRAGEFRTADRSFSFTQHLARVHRPVLMVCGREDLMAPLQASARHLPRLGSQDVQRIVLSRANGFSADYGHGDLIIGRNAPVEVYPIVLAWLRAVEAGCSATPRLPLPPLRTGTG
ncbi:MAG TPA: alpha/beta fold hydrolase [Myxococcota bacterium]|nr:alpha/beta fold hydrolase [Myxococcota bacterium]HRY94227.1 alpha/beta fold hydrolase [Myxococcota bacterium]HSA22777.1 alpha/beta fold hydrolase [Myxococcota bacterium]